VWAGDVQEELGIDEGYDEKSDCLFTFEVIKTNEQEENVVPRQGISVRISLFMLADAKAKAG